jgi:hypothetical protein
VGTRFPKIGCFLNRENTLVAVFVDEKATELGQKSNTIKTQIGCETENSKKLLVLA